MDDHIRDGATAAEKLILRWDSSSSSSSVGFRTQMLFDGEHRAQAERYLRAVEDVRRMSMRRSFASSSGAGNSSQRSSLSSLQLAMVRLEDEFRNILVSRVNDLDSDLLFSDLSSLSISSSLSFSAEEENEVEEERIGDGDESSIGRTETMGTSKPFRSSNSIIEVDLVPSDAVHDLRSIAEQMIAAGFEKECLQAYGSVRKAAVERCLLNLGLELNSGDINLLKWEVLELKIKRWIRAAGVCFRVVFSSERRLCDLVFEGLGDGSNDDSVPDVAFAMTVKPAALQLLGFPEAVVGGTKTPEKLFKIVELHDALRDLLPDMKDVFSTPFSSESSIYTQAEEVLPLLADAVRDILFKFENSIHSESSQTPTNGTIHPLTRYVMNYLSLITEYKEPLSDLIVTGPDTNRDIELPAPENELPLACHLLYIVAVLVSNIERKCNLYRDPALAQIFLLNNTEYIVHKIKNSPELLEMVGKDYIRRLTRKYQSAATNYQRAAWVRVLHCLREEGLHMSGNSLPGTTKAKLRERFKSFSNAFDETHRTQATWVVPDERLRQELRILNSEILLPAYRSFVGRYGSHIERERHPELYMKYSAEELGRAMEDFFEGPPASQAARRRPH